MTSLALYAFHHQWTNRQLKSIGDETCRVPVTSSCFVIWYGSVADIQKPRRGILESFYANLYGNDPICATVAQAFLDQVQLPWMDPSLLDQLNALITATEVTSAIASLASGKAPGPDGYTSEFFYIFLYIYQLFCSNPCICLLRDPWWGPIPSLWFSNWPPKRQRPNQARLLPSVLTAQFWF